MKTLLRFRLYDDPSRQTSTPLGEDIVENDIVHMGYGQAYRIGDEAVSQEEWPLYVVANLPRMKQIPDPDNAEKKVVLIEVFLAHFEQWEHFGFPEEFSEASDTRLD